MNHHCNVEPHVVARWESRGGKYWCELYRGPYGYSYRSPDAGGHFGPVTLGEAFCLMAERLPNMQADANKTAMRLTFSNLPPLPTVGTPPPNGLYRADSGETVRIHHGRPEPAF